jgi:ATP-dependent Clp protease adaptor protein ClpS
MRPERDDHIFPPNHSIWCGNEDDRPEERDEGETGTLVREKTKTKRPSLYKVLLLNDDYTPQEFVVWLLQSVFNRNIDDAMRIMLHVHQNGVGICGVYTFEVAETKVAQVMELSRQNQHPLQCTMEKE